MITQDQQLVDLNCGGCDLETLQEEGKKKVSCRRICTAIELPLGSSYMKMPEENDKRQTQKGGWYDLMVG